MNSRFEAAEKVVLDNIHLLKVCLLQQAVDLAFVWFGAWFGLLSG